MDEDASEIISGVWISRWQPALNEIWLKEHGIKAVFNCTKQVAFHPSVPYQYRIPLDDNLQPAEINNMEAWAPEIAYKMMREYKAGHPMLIHCHAGMQRSTTACAFFLMVLTGQPLIRVMMMIKQKRAIAFEPSPNFAVALRGFEEQVQQLRPRSDF
jgi:protein-tyrosine phosphatase